MKKAIWIPKDLKDEIEARGDNRSGIISRDLKRLYHMYHGSLPCGINEPEAGLICEVMKRTIDVSGHLDNLLWAEVDDQCNYYGLDKKWGVDKDSLVKRLRHMDDIQRMALIDAAERFWKPEKPKWESVREIFGMPQKDGQ